MRGWLAVGLGGMLGCSASGPAVGAAPDAAAEAGAAPVADAGTPASDAGADDGGGFFVTLDAAAPEEVDAASCVPPLPPPAPRALLDTTARGLLACSADGGVPPRVGPLPLDTVLRLSVSLPVRDPQGLEDYADGVSDPRSPLHGQYLTPAQYAARFAPTVCDYQAVIGWATAAGFTVVNRSDDRELLDIQGTAAVAAAALHVTFNWYRRADGSEFFAGDRAVTIDLSVGVLDIEGTDDCHVATPAGGGP